MIRKRTLYHLPPFKSEILEWILKKIVFNITEFSVQGAVYNQSDLFKVNNYTLRKALHSLITVNNSE